jgi:translation initiation factor 2 subunit 3
MTDAVLTIREADVLQRQATHLVGTLGHVSEGKSTLIRALTGIKTQRHAKEQERNITIHLGYANCRVYQNRQTGELRAVQTKEAGPTEDDGWTLIAHLSFVDCPGHEAYLATMLGGASVMDTACLIIAANQEVIPQPQTLEHLLAAELMGLERLVVVQNKLDLLSPEEAAINHDRIAAFTAGGVADVATAPLVPISAQHGWGTQRVLEYLTQLAPPTRELEAPARLTCVRSFDINRPGPVVPGAPALAGAVIGGTLERGVLAVGDWLEIRPGVLSRGPNGTIQATPILTRVRGLRCESTDLPYAIPGSLIAIATDLDPGLSIANGMVGQRVGVPGSLPPVVGSITIRLKKLKRDTFPFGKHRVGDRVRVCANVMTTEATLTEIDDKHRITLQLDRPLCLDVGERVALLRMNKEAGRELLEGSGEVRRSTPWTAVGTAEGAELATPPDRRVVWEPLGHERFESRPLPPYGELLDAVMVRKEEALGTAAPDRLRIPEPKLEVLHKHTMILNWTALCDALGDGAHLLDFVLAELQVAGSVNAQGQLMFRGRWRGEDIQGLLRRYARMFKKCAQCNGYATTLVRSGRILKVRCPRCQTDNLPNA